MSDALGVPAEVESMPAIETAVVAKLAVVGVAGFGFAGFAMAIDPTGIATGIATGITIIGFAWINVKKSYDKSNAGKTRVALKAEKAESARLRGVIDDQARATAELKATVAENKAEIARLNVVVDNWFKLWMEHEQKAGKPLPDQHSFNPAEHR